MRTGTATMKWESCWPLPEREAGYNYGAAAPQRAPLTKAGGIKTRAFYAPTSRYGTARELKDDKPSPPGVALAYFRFCSGAFRGGRLRPGPFDGTPFMSTPIPPWGSVNGAAANFMHSPGGGAQLFAILQPAIAGGIPPGRPADGCHPAASSTGRGGRRGVNGNRGGQHFSGR